MTRRPAVVVAVGAVLAALAAGCGSGAPASSSTAAPFTAPPTAPATAPTPSAAPSAVPPSPAPDWVVGARPLPLRPDGYGQVLPTPEVLRDRRLPTVDVLPPPAGGFEATVGPVSQAVRARMGETWSPDCPVALADLRYLTVSFRGFDGAAHTGELVVAASVADGVVEVFRRLFAEGFPVEEMRLVTTADLTAPPTGDGNNTAGYVCRAARGQTRWSQHAYGTAIDVNPFHNPMVDGDLVLPELASAYAARDDVRPGMHLADGPAVRAFSGQGWTWGGTWRSRRDPMHFSLSGG